MRQIFKAIVGAAVGVLIAGSAFAQGFTQNQLQPGIPTGPSLSSTVDPLAGVYFGVDRLGVAGHLETGARTGNTPALSSCGTSPALAAGSTDTAGKITVGTSASNACTLTFGTVYTAAPFCIVQNLTTGAAANVYAVSTTAITFSSALADSTVLMYHCIAASGG